MSVNNNPEIKSFDSIQISSTNTSDSSISTLSRTPSPDTISTKEGTPTPEKTKGGSVSHLAGKCLHGLNNTVGKTLTPFVFGFIGGAAGAIHGGFDRVIAVQERVSRQNEATTKKYEKYGPMNSMAADENCIRRIGSLVTIPITFLIGSVIGDALLRDPSGVITSGGLAGVDKGVNLAQNIHENLKETAKNMKKV